MSTYASEADLLLENQETGSDQRAPPVIPPPPPTPAPPRSRGRPRRNRKRKSQAPQCTSAKTLTVS